VRLIVGITGASGVILGYRLLQELRGIEEVETHLVLTEAAVRTLALETDIRAEELVATADYHYDNNDLAALISSGSFSTAGMIVAPCSMKTLSGIVSGFTTNLLIRAADVCLKEDRKLVLVPREMPLSKVHLKNLSAAADYGCRIIPPMLTFYNGPQTTEDHIQHVIGKVLMQFGLEHSKFKPWEGPGPAHRE
jgi:4-hydroxy-3-polyprenylbenzoate decarboxylase